MIKVVVGLIAFKFYFIIEKLLFIKIINGFSLNVENVLNYCIGYL